LRGLTIRTEPVTGASGWAQFNSGFAHDRRYPRIYFNVRSLGNVLSRYFPTLIRVVFDFWAIRGWHKLGAQSDKLKRKEGG
jgi:hypothetical protein